MHCTWFNEKKKRLIFPIFFCGLFSLLTRPHICRPHRPCLPLTPPLGKERHPHPVFPGVPRQAPWAPAQLACSF